MESAHLILEPLTHLHIPELYEEIGTDPDIYRWLLFPAPTSFSDFQQVLNGYIEESQSGFRIAHAVILKESGKAIGTTSYLDINPAQSSLEIGSTFYAKSYWRSYVNTECKLTLLTHAFEERNVERVTLKTDALNQRSRDAIARLGANFEGILRHHMRRPDGSWRDSAYYSILRAEWPYVKNTLVAKLDSYA